MKSIYAQRRENERDRERDRERERERGVMWYVEVGSDIL
jgi:hypothetical protein